MLGGIRMGRRQLHRGTQRGNRRMFWHTRCFRRLNEHTPRDVLRRGLRHGGRLRDGAGVQRERNGLAILQWQGRAAQNS